MCSSIMLMCSLMSMCNRSYMMTLLPNGKRDTFKKHLMNGFLFMNGFLLMDLSVKEWDMRRNITS